MVNINLSQHKLELEKYFSKQSPIVLVYLFGSQAQGKAYALSDVDIALLLEDSLYPQERLDLRLKIMVELDRILGRDNVDVVVLNGAPPALCYRVLRDGKLLYCRDNDQRIRLYLRTINEYLDFKPILERHEKAIIEKAKKGALLSGYDPHHGAIKHHRAIRELFKGTPKNPL